MRILISSLIDLKKSSHNSRLHQFLKYLVERHQITVLSINDWWKASWDDKSDDYRDDFNYLFDNIEYFYLTNKKISPVLQDTLSLIESNRIKDILKKDEYDMHFSYNCLCCGYVVAKYLKSKNVNTIYDIADNLPEMARTSPQIPIFLRPLGGLMSEIVMQKNIRSAKKITYTTKSLIDSYEISTKKLELIPNGVDTKVFKKYPSIKLKTKLGLNNSFVIGHVGVLREWLDFNPLFKAFKSLTNSLNLKLLIVGGGVGYNDVMRLAKKYRIFEDVVFAGTVPYSQVPDFISCMDVGIIPFKLDRVSQDSQPLKLFEYMACETPVIATNVKGIIESVGDLVIYASDVDDYREKIIMLYNDEELRRKMGLIGRKFVEENYDWSKISSNLESVLKKSRDI